MRKFKLIKNYPDSMLEIGDELVFNDSQVVVTRQIENFDYDYSLDNCIKYKEFWQEVIEINYKILKLSLQRSVRPEIIDVSDSGEGYILSLLNCQGNSIHSIKRLSDGKIFTIGDKVQDSLTDKLTNHAIQEITYFYPGEKIICQAKSGTTMPLNTIRHTSFLFKTEDGVDISEGNEFWVYNYGALKGTSYEIHKVSRASQTNTGNGVDRKYFSTKEKAEEYILLNKPCLSINDVRNCLNQTEIDIDNEHELNYQLLQLVKEKSNGNK